MDSLLVNLFRGSGISEIEKDINAVTLEIIPRAFLQPTIEFRINERAELPTPKDVDNAIKLFAMPILQE